MATNAANRCLIQRGNTYYYMRRVPLAVSVLDTRSPLIRQSLRTEDLALARAQRDILEQADNDLWGAMLRDGGETSASRASYQAAQIRAQALGFAYRPAGEIATQPIEEIVRRVVSVMSAHTPAPVEQAVLGGQDLPKTKVSDAFKVYCEEITAQEIAGKSREQQRQWKKVKQKAVDSFIEVIADKPMVEITRADGQAFYRHWLAKVVNKGGKKALSASYGNRMVGNMRVLYEQYFKYLGEDDRTNPFANLNFTERFKKSRPPVPVAWLKEKFLKPGRMANMNDEGRGVILALIETGARPSEICNLTREQIKVTAKVPHIVIEPRNDPDDPREIKTQSSVRTVPLVGVALAVFKRHPNGFPRYKDKESSMSATLNKFMRENDMFPTPDHKVYSFRHSFEDRMKEAGLDDELRRMLMGHTIDRPKYGSGGSLEWKQKELLKIALPYDEAIV